MRSKTKLFSRLAAEKTSDTLLKLFFSCFQVSASFPGDPARGKGRVGNRGRSSGEYISTPPPLALRRRRSDYPIPRSPLSPPPSAFVTGIQIEKSISSPTILLPEIGAINPQLGGRTEKSFMCVVFFPRLAHRNLPGCSGEKVANFFSAFLRRDGSWSSSENAEMQERCLSSCLFPKECKKASKVQKRVFLACS